MSTATEMRDDTAPDVSEYIATIVAGAPRLTTEQRDHIAAILRGGAGG